MIPPAPPTVTILERETPARIALNQLLQEMGFQVSLTEESPSWEIYLPEQTCPLVFVGWQLWEEHAAEIIRHFRKQDLPSPPKIMLFVSQDTPLNLWDAVQLGIDGYITYPFSSQSLRQKIQTLVPHSILTLA